MVLDKILRAGDAKTMRRIEKLADLVESLEGEYQHMSNEELQACTEDFKNRLNNGEPIDQLIPEAFAVSREASRRVLGKFPYRVQLIGGIALHLGNIAEMATGSGKAVPLTTPLPTPQGWVTAGEVKIGDYLFDRLGNPTRVQGVYPQGKQDTYRVTFEHGRFLDCNSEHLWAVHTPEKKEQVETLTTQQIIDLGGVGVFEIPESGSAQEEPVTSLYERITPGDYGANFQDTPDTRPASYGSIQQRWELLQGIVWENFFMTTVNEDRKNLKVGVRLRSPEVREVVSEIFHSLAIPVRKMGKGADLLIMAPGHIVDALFEKEATRPTSIVSPREKIISIEKLPEQTEQACFTVDNEEHLFLAGEYIPTHNTLTAVAPSYLNGLTGKGVHVVTTNDYLAQTQQEDMGRVYSFLGLTSAVILNNFSPDQRREAYKADITYGTNNEFGFDYLRDNLVQSLEEKVQRGHHYIIVDEADSILIDDAKTPLIISGQPEPDNGASERWFKAFAQFATQLREGEDYEVDFKKKTTDILEPALDKIEDWLGIDNLYDESNAFLVSFLYNAIKAKELFRKDYEYVVSNGEVLIVDPSTGRTMPGRRYSDGIHQAIEAKEAVQIQPESMTTSTVTLQAYVGLYEKVAGMTGTAYSEAAEMMDTYNLGVVQVPNHRPIQRVEHPDSMFVTEERKYQAIVEDVATRHRLGQPVLIGTASVEKSERISKELSRAGIRHEVLNANNHAREAGIIAQAGREGSVTVATNMAGRGTDILLGGNPEFDAKVLAEREGLSPGVNLDEYNRFVQEAEKRLTREYSLAKEKVLSLGGLCVIGTERHDSRRIDDQLKGRSGRQGDPGEAKFYLSLEDQLVEHFGGNLAESLKRLDPDLELSSKMVSRLIEGAQGQIKSRDAEQRKNSLKYEEALNWQREAVYRDRDMVLGTEDPISLLTQVLTITLTDLQEETDKLPRHQRNLEDFYDTLKNIYPTPPTPEELTEEYGDIEDWDIPTVIAELKTDYLNVTQEAVQKAGEQRIQASARSALLKGYDQNYPLHLSALDYLKQGIGLRALAQKNPAHEYQQEANSMYTEFMRTVRDTATHNFYAQAQQILREPAGGLQWAQPAAQVHVTALLEALRHQEKQDSN